MNEHPDIVGALQASRPFEALPAPLLAEVAAIGRVRHCRPGETIYEAGAPADAIYLVIRGEVEHALDPAAAASPQAVQRVGPGVVFGWAALIEMPSDDAPRLRLARAESIGESDVVALQAAELQAVLAAHPDIGQDVMRRFAQMVRQQYGFTGFVKVGDHFVPATIPASDSPEPRDYDTFAF